MQAYIPSTWAMSNIGAISDVVAGGTPKADDKSNFSAPGTGFAWLTPADLSGYMEKYISHGSRDLSEKGLATSSAKLMPAGALLFSSRAPIGYVAIAANKISTNQGFKNFVFSNEIASTYAYYFLKSIRGLAESLGTGTTFKEISGATAKTLPFVIPPFAEQKEISDRLDKLLAQVEATQARLAHIPDIIKRFRQSVLAAAVSGKLTEEWRKPCPYQSINKDLTAPSCWSKCYLGEIVNYVTSGSRGWAKYYSTNGSLFIRSQDISADKLIIEDAAFVDLPAKAEGTRTKVEPFDLLVTITGANVTKCALVDVDLDDAYVSQHVALIRLADSSNAKFLDLVLKSPNAGRKQLTSMAYGGGKPGLNLQNIKDVTFALPSQEEQTEIVRRVEQLFAYADTIEQQAKAAKERVDNLTQAILAKAFRGELTADWRAANPDLISGDNSAAALLARIQAERATASGKKGKRGTSKTRTTD